MDVSALVHRHAEAVVIHACHIRHIYLLCFALMTFLFPRQLEEMQLINDVALLDSRLKQAGGTYDETMYLFRDFDDRPFAKRLKLWRFRKDMRHKLLANMLLRSAVSAPSASSGETAATSPPVTKQETERKKKIELIWRIVQGEVQI
jgi:hypothetical protein